MKRIIALILSALIISALAPMAFADEIEPYYSPAGAESETVTGSSGYGNSGFETREETVRFSNLCFAGAVTVSAAGWITLIMLNKKKKAETDSVPGKEADS